jgi:hypothetical protein
MPRKQEPIALLKPDSPVNNSAKRLGKDLLAKECHAVVLYKDKQWDLVVLLEHLIKRIRHLERHQCKPSAKCLFVAQEYLDDK